MATDYLAAYSVDGNLSGHAAGELLAHMTRDHQASQAAERAAATAEAEKQGLARLDRIKDITPAQADARIAALSRDDAFMKRYLAGGSAERREMDDLHAAKIAGARGDSILDETALADAANKGQSGPVPIRDVLAVVEGFRTEGLSDDAIRHALENRPVSPEEHDEVRRLQARRLGDPEWVKKMLAGYPDAVRDLHLMSIVLSSPIAAAA